MFRLTVGAAAALLCLSTLAAPAAVPSKHPAAAGPRAMTPTTAPMAALQAAVAEVAAGQNGGSYAQWLDSLPGFHFSSSTEHMLLDAFGTDRLFSVERLPTAAGVHDYSLTVPARHAASPDGTTLDWTTMHGQLTAPADGASMTTRIVAPTVTMASPALQIVMQNVMLAAISRRGTGTLSFGAGSFDIGSMQLSSPLLGMAATLNGLYTKYFTLDQGKTVTLQYENGIRAIDVAGARVEDIHVVMRMTGVDKAALEAFNAHRTQLAKGPAGLDPAMQRAMAGPLMQELGAAFLTRGATLTLDDASFRYRGSVAHIHGQAHFDNATPADLANPELALKKLVAHVDLAVPAAMLRAFADISVRSRAAKMGKPDSATLARDTQAAYDNLLRQAMATGWIRVQGDMLVSTVDLHDGNVFINGKPVALPKRPAPMDALDSQARYGGMRPARRIPEQCTLPNFPHEVIAQNEPLMMSIGLIVNLDGSVGNLRLTRSSGIPAYDHAVLAAAAHCMYIPAARDGKPVPMPSVWNVVRVPGSVHP